MSRALTVMAESAGVSEEEITEVVKGMIISSKSQHGAVATNAEIAVVTSICAKYDLNPLVSECAAFVSGGKLQMIVMIAGWYKMVNRQESFDGVEFYDNFDEDNKLVSTTCNMHLTNRGHPVSVTEYLGECNDPKSTVWRRWPARMLRHKAYIQAARMAFGITEVIDDDEASRIKYNSKTEKDITPQPPVDFDAIEQDMNECGDLDTLKKVCGDIREFLKITGAWDQSRGKIIALNIKHKDRINSYASTVTESTVTAEEKDVLNEVIEGELVEEEIGFGEDITDEFGETSADD